MSESTDRIPAFGYLRVSGKDQIDGYGFPRQREAIENYAVANGYEIVRWFEERGVSGTKHAESRPAWSEMLLEMRSAAVKTIIIERTDRLARDVVVQELAISGLREAGLHLLSAHEPELMRDDPSTVLVRQLLGSIAGYIKSELVCKLRASRNKAKAEKGRCEGRKPYGHHAGEGSILEQMQAMRSAGMTCEQIAAALNSQGIPTRYGHQWQFSGVAKILRRAK